jgi:hypothetical protein
MYPPTLCGHRGHGSFQASVLTCPDAFTSPLRKHAMHQMASTTWRATAGHMRTPTSLAPATAFARTATAAQLYSSIAATNPRRARLGPSSRASQQAPPNESNAAPATRVTIIAAGASSDAPSNNAATSGGESSSVMPAAVSTNAVTIRSVLAISCTNNHPSFFRPPCRARDPCVVPCPICDSSVTAPRLSRTRSSMHEPPRHCSSRFPRLRRGPGGRRPRYRSVGSRRQQSDRGHPR